MSRSQQTITRIEYGDFAIVTTVPVSRREQIHLRSQLRRMSLSLDRAHRKWMREFNRYLKTPEGEQAIIDRIVALVNK